MNFADSRRVADALSGIGFQPVAVAEHADVIVLNTCVVRQSAEDKAYGRLTSLKSYKQRHPEVVINLMGCLVGVKEDQGLRKRFPYVDVFSPPSDPQPLIDHLRSRLGKDDDARGTRERIEIQDGVSASYESHPATPVAAFVPVVLGCSHACTYCVIPFRRGDERSRPLKEVASEVKKLVADGTKEITLLGQIVDRYGLDLPERLNLSVLLTVLSEIEGLERIRFLTSHPLWMTDELLNTAARLPKVMPHIEVPVQAGDDEILRKMRRGYTAGQYRELVQRIRDRIPGVAIATDVIVGFPGETADQFQHTYELVDELRMDVAHLARYSPRPGTYSAEHLSDDVSVEEKWQRFRALEELQEKIVTGINARLLGTVVSVLFEEKSRSRWRGRTPTNKLVFVESGQDLHGKTVPVSIKWTGPWSLIGELAG